LVKLEEMPVKRDSKESCSECQSSLNMVVRSSRVPLSLGGKRAEEKVGGDIIPFPPKLSGLCVALPLVQAASWAQPAQWDTFWIPINSELGKQGLLNKGNHPSCQMYTWALG
jgi:hypothetical protein